MDLNGHKYSFKVPNLEGTFSWNQNYQTRFKHKRHYNTLWEFRMTILKILQSFHHPLDHQPLKLFLQLTSNCWSTWRDKDCIASTQRSHTVQIYTLYSSKCKKLPLSSPHIPKICKRKSPSTPPNNSSFYPPYLF